MPRRSPIERLMVDGARIAAGGAPRQIRLEEIGPLVLTTGHVAVCRAVLDREVPIGRFAVTVAVANLDGREMPAVVRVRFRDVPPARWIAAWPRGVAASDPWDVFTSGVALITDPPLLDSAEPVEALPGGPMDPEADGGFRRWADGRAIGFRTSRDALLALWGLGEDGTIVAVALDLRLPWDETVPVEVAPDAARALLERVDAARQALTDRVTYDGLGRSDPGAPLFAWQGWGDGGTVQAVACCGGPLVHLELTPIDRNWAQVEGLARWLADRAAAAAPLEVDLRSALDRPLAEVPFPPYRYEARQRDVAGIALIEVAVADRWPEVTRRAQRALGILLHARALGVAPDALSPGPHPRYVDVLVSRIRRAGFEPEVPPGLEEVLASALAEVPS